MDPFYGMVEEMHPFALATKADAADNPTWEQAMNGPDLAGYWEACRKELHTLADKKNAWDVVERQPWMNFLPSTWAFRCKRYPDTIYIKTQVFRLLRYYSPAPRNIARSDWATQNITHNMTSSKT